MDNEKIHVSPSRVFNFMKNPLRALEDYQGKINWWEGDKSAVLYGTIVHNIAEGVPATQGFTQDDLDLIISRSGKNKGDLKANFQDAKVVGQALRHYIQPIVDREEVQFEVSFRSPDELDINEQLVQFDLTGRADMLTDNVVYDFKTVAPQEFDGLAKYGSFRDGLDERYKMQIALYAAIFEKDEAHILYVKKHKTKPFIFDYKLNEYEINNALQRLDEEIEQVVKYISGLEKAPAVNDGSQWAYDYFKGVIKRDEITTI